MSDGFTEAMRGSESFKGRVKAKIISQTLSTWLELPESLEDDGSTEKPYQIERRENLVGKIVWYGYSTNWVKKEDGWFKTKGPEFTPCEMPEYEKIFQFMK